MKLFVPLSICILLFTIHFLLSFSVCVCVKEVGGEVERAVDRGEFESSSAELNSSIICFEPF